MKLTSKIGFLFVAVGLVLNFPARAAEISPIEARAIAKEAYI